MTPIIGKIVGCRREILRGPNRLSVTIEFEGDSPTLPGEFGGEVAVTPHPEIAPDCTICPAEPAE